LIFLCIGPIFISVQSSCSIEQHSDQTSQMSESDDSFSQWKCISVRRRVTNYEWLPCNNAYHFLKSNMHSKQHPVNSLPIPTQIRTWITESEIGTLTLYLITLVYLLIYYLNHKNGYKILFYFTYLLNIFILFTTRIIKCLYGVFLCSLFTNIFGFCLLTYLVWRDTKQCRP
jgi:hypothetical protein